MKNNFCQVWLTCASAKEAEIITNTLLVKHLVACVHKVPITSDFHWQGKIRSSKEVLLQMDSHEDLFEEVEHEIAKLHSYNSFVLEALPLSRVSKKAEAWLREELKNAKT